MAIVINIAAKPIDVDINGLHYSIPRNDKLLKEIDDTYKEITKRAEEADENPSDDAMNDMRGMLKEVMDTMLQKEGAFEEIERSLSDDGEQYTMAMMEILGQLYREFEQEVVSGMAGGRYDKKV